MKLVYLKVLSLARCYFLFILMIDLPASVESDCFLFADDCFLLNEIQSSNLSAFALNKDLAAISLWANQWLVTMNE